MSIPLILAAVVSTASGACSWAHPGANPYRGDPVAALSDFQMSDESRQKLRAMMAAHQYTDVVKITRDDITGKDQYSDLRDMHSGHGSTCHGAVDRSAWSDTLEERGLVYCVGDTCVVVPTVCNNVSLVSRKPSMAAGADAMPDTGPIDIEPAAGPPVAANSAPLVDTASPQGIAAPPADTFAGGPTVSPQGSGPVFGEGPCCSAGGGGGGGGGGSGGGGGGGTVVVPPLSAIPEAPTWWMLLAGVGVLAAYARRPRAGIRQG